MITELRGRGVAVLALLALQLAGHQPLDGGDELDGGPQLEPHHRRQVALRQPRQTRPVYQVV